MSDPDVARFPCPCCGRLTLHDSPGSYDICPVCFWEDDDAQLRRPTLKGGANDPCSIEAQEAYVRHGAIEQRFLAHVREPTAEEALELGWRPIDLEQDSFEHKSDNRADWPRDLTTLYWWRSTFWRATT